MGYNKLSKNVLLTKNPFYKDNQKIMEIFGVHSKTNNVIRIFFEEDIDFRIEFVKDNLSDVPIFISQEYGTLNYDEIIIRF